MFRVAILVAGIICFATSLKADMIELKGSKKLFGQTISISDKVIYLETIHGYKLEVGSLPRTQIIRITDESGQVLYDDNKVLVENVRTFYRPILNNWEALNARFKDSKDKTLYLTNHRIEKGHIVTITEQFIFLEQPKDGTEEEKRKTVNRFKLSDVTKIEQTAVIIIKEQAHFALQEQKEKFPIYKVSTGINILAVNHIGLQDLFKDIHQAQGSNEKVLDRNALFLGLDGRIEMLLTENYSLGLMIYYFKEQQNTRLSVSIADVKYTFDHLKYKPWVSLGMAGQAISVKETILNENYTWKSSKVAPVLAVGAGYGKNTGLSYGIAFRYMPFGREDTNSDISGVEVKNRVDLTLWMLSVKMHFGFK